MTFSPELLKELIATFQTELQEGASVLVNGLVSLETATDSAKRKEDIETIFRTAHNLKGASRSLGIMPIGDIAHAIESIFAEIKKADGHVTKEIIDLCLESVDKMQLAMQAFVDNKPLDFNLDDLKKRLSGQTTVTSKDPVNKLSSSNVQQTANDKKYVVDSIRIPLRIIDKLSALSEEVQASKIELDDHANHTKLLMKMVNDFDMAWKDVSEQIRSSKLEDAVRLQKSMTRANDELLSLMTTMTRMAKDIKAQSNDYARLSQALHEEVVQLRLIPAYNLLGLLPRYARELANDLGKKVEVEIKGGEAYLDKYVLEGLKDPFNHIIRNAIDHGIEKPDMRVQAGKSEIGTITIDVKDAGSKIYFEIRDDGAGINLEAIRDKLKNDKSLNVDVAVLQPDELYQYIFDAGFSTRSEITDISGRGVGMDVVKRNILNLKGTISIDSTPGKGTTFIICVPLSLSSERGLIVKSEEQLFVIPASAIDRVLTLPRQSVVALEGGHAVLINDHPIVLKSLANVLQINHAALMTESVTVVIVKQGLYAVALSVDSILGEREIVIKPIQDPLTNVPCIAGATLLERNNIAIVLDADMLLKLSLKAATQYLHHEDTQHKVKQEAVRVLVVDDSITTRTMEKNILESKNFDVTIATNGQEAWDILQKQHFSLMITDVNMPIMDGFELTNKVKKSEKFTAMPVIIVTSLGSESEKARGIEVGADAYIVKNEFESGVLLQLIDQLI